jgi:hypothetical protein
MSDGRHLHVVSDLSSIHMIRNVKDLEEEIRRQCVMSGDDATRVLTCLYRDGDGKEKRLTFPATPADLARMKAQRIPVVDLGVGDVADDAHRLCVAWTFEVYDCASTTE